LKSDFGRRQTPMSDIFHRGNRVSIIRAQMSRPHRSDGTGSMLSPLLVEHLKCPDDSGAYAHHQPCPHSPASPYVFTLICLPHRNPSVSIRCAVRWAFQLCSGSPCTTPQSCRTPLRTCSCPKPPAPQLPVPSDVRSTCPHIMRCSKLDINLAFYTRSE
jgi:nitrite reductase/ring-hydroxylating ferredoxin subunit